MKKSSWNELILKIRAYIGRVWNWQGDIEVVDIAFSSFWITWKPIPANALVFTVGSPSLGWTWDTAMTPRPPGLTVAQRFINWGHNTITVDASRTCWYITRWSCPVWRTETPSGLAFATFTRGTAWFYTNYWADFSGTSPSVATWRVYRTEIGRIVYYLGTYISRSASTSVQVYTVHHTVFSNEQIREII